ncbi:MAG: peptidoglycan-binding protein [Scytonema sp. RU_4_4]|nr:peptidoglycan-binding protein [Scytonema sp. RU_4_4]NJR74779.1 peptidoglycan-binding protein [Scytonema sp. CRU_2_7]
MSSTSDTSDTMQEVVQIQISKPVLRQNSKGRAVKELQHLLSYWGVYTGPVNGNFEQQTEHGVKDYQRRVFLQEDGVVAEHTWLALYTGAPVYMPELSKGCSGEQVRIIQRVLKSTNDYVGWIDSDFGDLTEAAVTSFQRRCELPVTGVVDEDTWYALSQV